MTSRKIVPVILSGGAGTRLWPLSRPKCPKQFHALTGERTMLQMTAARVADGVRFEPPVVVAGAAHAGEVERQFSEASLDLGALVLEPTGRNTAAAIALAALELDGDALMLVMPSDHVIGRPEAFLNAVARAAGQAEQGWLMTFGITPDRPETGYGYIRCGASLADGAFAVDRFVEKPDRATAEAYLAEGGYDWNGGIFLLRAGDLISGLKTHAPDILDATRAALTAARREGRRVLPDPELFAAVRSQSIDHALMEVHHRVGVVPVEMDWSDVGSWDALYDIGGKDAGGNVLVGDAIARDSRGCLVHAEGFRVVTVGVSDLIVVASGGTILVLPRGESQRVREAVEAASTAS
jgi:mannose-1-phosphate guanylyltransferase/mannose-1-phosphate guanylyltransferase/mannose-6-phosphate isomerase